PELADRAQQVRMRRPETALEPQRRVVERKVQVGCRGGELTGSGSEERGLQSGLERRRPDPRAMEPVRVVVAAEPHRYAGGRPEDEQERTREQPAASGRR